MKRGAFWAKISFVLTAMATYKAATGFTALVIPLVLVETKSIDKEDEERFNLWVSIQVFAVYAGETVGELLTGILTDKHPKMLKKMLLLILLLAAASYIGQGLVAQFLLEESLGVVMGAMTVVRFFNGFFSPAVLGSLASFQLVERQINEEEEKPEDKVELTNPDELDLRTKVENLRPIALYVGDMVGCVFIGMANVLSLGPLFYIIAGSYFLMFVCIMFTIPDPIFTGNIVETKEELEEADPLIVHNAPIQGPNWWLFKYYIWNRAVIYIFLANMMNSLFNSIVGSDQVLYLGISEVLLAGENLAGSLLGVAVAWLFMTYAFRRMGSTKALVLFAIISFGCLVGMPWFILDLVLSVVISIVYTPIIITQDAIAIISGASFAIRTIENSEGFAYGFLNGASMIACGLAPFVYTGLLAILSKTMVWIVLSLTFIAMVIAEVFYQGWIRSRTHSKLSPSKPMGAPDTFKDVPSINSPADDGDGRHSADHPVIYVSDDDHEHERPLSPNSTGGFLGVPGQLPPRSRSSSASSTSSIRSRSRNRALSITSNTKVAAISNLLSHHNNAY